MVVCCFFFKEKKINEYTFSSFLKFFEIFFFSFMIVSYWQTLPGESHTLVCEDLVPHHLFLECDTKNALALPTK